MFRLLKVSNSFARRLNKFVQMLYKFSSQTNHFVDVDLYKDIEASQIELELERTNLSDQPVMTLEEMKRSRSAQIIKNPTPISCDEIIQFLADKCVSETCSSSPLVIDIRDKSFMADYLIFCSVPSANGLRNLALELKKAFSGRPVRSLVGTVESMMWLQKFVA